MSIFIKLIERFKQLTQPVNMAGPVLFSIHAMVWGAWLLAPWSTFGSPAWATMAAVAPEWAWGSLAVVVGLIAFCNALRLSATGIKIASMLSFLFWFFIGFSFALGDWHSTGVVTYFLIAFYSAYTYINLSLNEEEFNKARTKM